MLHVQDPPVEKFDISKDVFKVVKDFGVPHNNDFNGVRQNGVGTYQVSAKENSLNGSRMTFLILFLNFNTKVYDERWKAVYIG